MSGVELTITLRIVQFLQKFFLVIKSEYADLILSENPARLLEDKTLKPIGQILAETARGSGFLSDEEYWGI